VQGGPAGLDQQSFSLRARVAAGLARACIYLDDPDAAARASEQALAIANQCDDRTAVVATLRARQLVRSGPDGTDERFGLAAQMLEIGREASDPEPQMWSHLWRIDVLFQRGDLAGVGRELDPLAWCVDEVGGPVARWQLLRCQAAHAQAQARSAGAIRLANEGFTELIPLSTWVRDSVLGGFFWDFERSVEVLRLCREVVTDLPRDASSVVADQHKRLIDPIRAVLPPLFEFVTPMRYIRCSTMGFPGAATPTQSRSLSTTYLTRRSTCSPSTCRARARPGRSCRSSR
jgi:hypothetical protein